MKLIIFLNLILVAGVFAQPELTREKALLLSKRLNPAVLDGSEAREILTRLRLKYDSATFFQCINTPDVPAVKLFLSAGADPNDRLMEFGHQTALIAAVFNGDLDLVRLLVQAGAEVNARDGDESTALIKAANIGKGDIARYLLEQGADPMLRTKLRSNALQGAAGKGDIDLAKALMAKGLDVNAADLMGNTPLMSAVSHGQEEMVAFLLSKGANFSLKTYKGKAAIDIATELGLTPIATLLQAHQSTRESQ